MYCLCRLFETSQDGNVVANRREIPCCGLADASDVRDIRQSPAFERGPRLNPIRCCASHRPEAGWAQAEMHMQVDDAGRTGCRLPTSLHGFWQVHFDRGDP